VSLARTMRKRPRAPRPALAVAAALLAVGLPLGACGRDEPDLPNGKAQFVENCGQCHVLARAGTAGTQGPSLDAAFQAALAEGIDRDTVKGVVEDQIAHPRRGSIMPPGIVEGEDASDVAAYVGYAAARPGDDTGALASAGLAQATTGEQIFTAGGCAGCHTFQPAGSTGTIGPDLDDLASAAGDMPPEEFVRQSILDPNAEVAQGFNSGVMPSFEGRLSDEQVQALVDYLLGQ
jgi:cbb3-type cytochrome c oxidase subunit III